MAAHHRKGDETAHHRNRDGAAHHRKSDGAAHHSKGDGVAHHNQLGSAIICAPLTLLKRDRPPPKLSFIRDGQVVS